MDFFERQSVARRNTKWLLLYFFVCVALTILLVYAAAAIVFLKLEQHGNYPFYTEQPSAPLWHPQLFLGISIGTILVVLLAYLKKSSELARGGSVVATALGGRPIDPHSTDLNEQKLRNVVEEMSIAAGVPVPEIYVLDDESGINAFAAGHTTSDAAIGVTRGAIETLERDELQGVVAHEFSHILNGDMRLNVRLMAWIFGIVCIAIVGRTLLRVRSSNNNRKGSNPLPLFGLLLIIIGGIGVFFGRLIQAAVSRQREFLADAAAVQFTRNPAGLAGALKKIGGISSGSHVESSAASEASHMFFANGISETWLALMQTHPPLLERIRLLDPSFDGKYPTVTVGQTARDHSRSAAELPPRIPVAAAGVLSQLGAPTMAHVEYSASLLRSIPRTLTAATREPFSATTIIYSLLLSQTDAIRALQLKHLGAKPAIAAETLKRLTEVKGLDAQLKLPLAELVLPTLRQLSQSQYEEFKSNVRALVDIDEQIDLFEFALQKMLLRHLESHFGQTRKPIVQYYALMGLTTECSLLISALAHVGHNSPAQVDSAYRTGIDKLQLNPAQVHFYELNECTLDSVDAALQRLDQSAPPCKRALLEACIATISRDGIIQPGEGELLRAIADSLDCPIPPLITI